MKQAEYDELIGFCKARLKNNPYGSTACSRYAEAYQNALLAVMSKAHEIQKGNKNGK